MKKKSLSRHKRGNSARHDARSTHAKPHQIRKKKKSPSASTLWLRILPISVEDDPPTLFLSCRTESSR
jgi:hypothetical protein